MRSIYIYILFLFVSNLYAQEQSSLSYEAFCRDNSLQVGSGITEDNIAISHGAIFPNYTLSDISGVSHDIYSILDQGKTVVLEIMEFSGSLSKEEVKYLNHIKEVYQDQEDMIEILAIERTAHTNISLNVNNWYNDNNLTYPLINMDDLDSFLGGEVAGLPTFFIISPDKSYTKVYGFNYAHHILSTINKEVLASSGIDSNYDLDLFNVEYDFCGNSKNIYLTLQNTGAHNTFPFTINFYDETNQLIDSIYQNRIIKPNSRIEYDFYFHISDLNTNTVRIEIISTQPLENTLNNSRTISFVENQVFSGTQIEIQIQTDIYPEETAWKLYNSTSNVIVNQDGFDSDGNIVGISNGLHIIPQSVIEGDCYLLQVYDSVGDGLCCSYGNGFIKIVDNTTGITLSEGEDFDILESLQFKVSSAHIGINEFELANEAKEIKNIQYFDLLGREVEKVNTTSIMIKKTTFSDDSIETEKIHGY